ncbi:MAG: methyltransferase domain-containing protein [Candidatus Bathyarchaeota archaeon]|nr:methyltransferase domain-containing protein [Candidatus Bathyarchaeota archaeon]
MTSIDLGCGNNKISKFFVGVDNYSATQADVTCDMTNLSMYKDSSVTIVTSRRAIQHVEDDVQVFREINRILTPDGVAIIEVASTLNSVVSQMLNRLKIKKYRYKLFHIYTASGIKKRVRESGLRIVTYAKSPTKLPFYNHVIVAMKGELDVNKNTA